MTAIDYPSELLPMPLVASASHQEQVRLLRTNMDSGYAVVRKRFTTVPTFFDVRFLFDQGQLAYFQMWFNETLDQGLNWFNMNLPVGDSLLSPHEVRFMENPKYELNGNFWNVSFKLEAVALQLSSGYDSVMLGLIASLGGFTSTGQYFDKLDVAINDTYPASGYGPNA